MRGYEDNPSWAGKAVLLQNFPLLSQADLYLLKLQAHLEICRHRKEGTIYNSPHSTIFVSVDSELVNHKCTQKLGSVVIHSDISFKRHYREEILFPTFLVSGTSIGTGTTSASRQP